MPDDFCTAHADIAASTKRIESKVEALESKVDGLAAQVALVLDALVPRQVGDTLSGRIVAACSLLVADQLSRRLVAAAILVSAMSIGGTATATAILQVAGPQVVSMMADDDAGSDADD